MRRGVSFYLYQERGDRVSMAQPLLMDDFSPELIPQPAFTLTNDDAQVMIDELWRAGLRPTEGNGSAGAMAAQGKHLDDMRKIAFNGLGLADAE
jgi:hypothetical protein